VSHVLREHPSLSGLYQVASSRTSKFDLLAMIRERFGMQDVLTLVPDDTFACDRSLHGERFRAATGIEVPTWDAMITALAEASERYGSVDA
jgi:dTDP-4-dehydrorhamnose reductase